MYIHFINFLGKKGEKRFFSQKSKNVCYNAEEFGNHLLAYVVRTIKVPFV